VLHTVNSNNRTANCQCSLFSKKNQIIRIFCISRYFALPIIRVNWSSTVPLVCITKETWKPFKILVLCGFVYICNVWGCVCVGFVLYGCVRFM